MIKLVLIRHGESEWNKENRFTGWTDVDLSEKGRSQAADAGKRQHDGELGAGPALARRRLRRGGRDAIAPGGDRGAAVVGRSRLPGPVDGPIIRL